MYKRKKSINNFSNKVHLSTYFVLISFQSVVVLNALLLIFISRTLEIVNSSKWTVSSGLFVWPSSIKEECQNDNATEM